MYFYRILIAIAFIVQSPSSLADSLQNIDHIIIIYGENRSFDNLYGMFPGADGVMDLKSIQYQQVDNDGNPFKYLPQVWKKSKKIDIDPQFEGKPALPNHPFRLDANPYNISLNEKTRDLVHRFYQHQEQINEGRNDRFAAVSDAGGLVMGYYDGSNMRLWKFAQEYTLADHFFMAAFGGSFLNHMWLACACTPVYPNAPPEMKSNVDASRIKLTRKKDSPSSALDGPPKWNKDAALTDDGFAVNTMQPPYQPSEIPPANDGDPRMASTQDGNKLPLPPQNQPTIGDRLSDKHVSWIWYSGGWNQALEDRMQEPSILRKVIKTLGKVMGDKNNSAQNFQTHHQPYNYFENYAPGTSRRKEHLKDYKDLLSDIEHGALPSVVFYKPQGNLNQHPGYANVLDGDEHIAELIDKIRKGTVLL